MTHYILLIIGTALINNFVLVKFLGLCPFMGVSKKIETAVGMGLATMFVLTVASLCIFGRSLYSNSLKCHFFTYISVYFSYCCSGAIYRNGNKQNKSNIISFTRHFLAFDNYKLRSTWCRIIKCKSRS